MKLYLVDDNDKGIRYFQSLGKDIIYYLPDNPQLSVIEHITSLRSIYSEKTLRQYAYFFLTILGINGGIPWESLKYSQQRMVKILQTYLLGHEGYVYVGFVDGFDIDDIKLLNEVIAHMHKLNIKEPIHLTTDFFIAGNIKAKLYILLETEYGEYIELPVNGERGPKMGLRLLPVLLNKQFRINKETLLKFLHRYPRKFKYIASLLRNFKDYLALVWLLQKGYARYDKEKEMITFEVNPREVLEDLSNDRDEKIGNINGNAQEKRMD